MNTLNDYYNTLDNTPVYVVVFELKKCWITEDKSHFGTIQPQVGDEVISYPHDAGTVLHIKGQCRYSRPQVRYLKFVEYRLLDSK